MAFSRMSEGARMRRTIALAMLGMLAGCVAPPAPPPAPPAPPPAPPAPPPPTDWRDTPLTPGGWSYSPGAAASEARFGVTGAAPVFVARCDRAKRQVTLMRPAPATTSAPPVLVVTTSAGARTIPAGTIPDTPGMIGAIALASDPFLDKMAFSRGRFVIALAGAAPLFVPSWPEFARVIEDCRG
jgi:hypothetical protein